MTLLTLRTLATVLSTASLLGCTGGVSWDDSGDDSGNSGGSSAQSGGSSNSGGSSAGGSGGSPSGTPGVIDLSGEAKRYRFVRLTNSQWAKSVQDVLRLSAPSGLESRFQSAVAGTTDFLNNEHLLDVNQRAWADYRDTSEELAEQVTSSSTALAALYEGTDATGFIQTVGQRAYRRPLTASEVQSYEALFTAGTQMSGDRSEFAKGAALVLRALLQSPHFLYRTELTPAGQPLSGYEVAAKLSLWLRDTTPNDELLEAAPTLTTAEAVAAEATKMLEEPNALAVMREFERELLHFDRYSQISKVNVPEYTEALNAEYEQSSYLFFDRIFREGLGVKDIFTTTKGFVGPAMAELYGIEISGTELVERDLGPSRAGYFAQLPFLTLHGLNGEPDSIHRGVALNLDVLCAPLGPPATVIPPVPPLQPGQTNRQRIDTLTGGCGGSCHNEMINPLGFAFENFDGMGQYREVENGGLPIDSSGTYKFSDGEQSFENSAELMQALAESEQTHLCYAKKMASYGLQRDIVAEDLPLITQLAAVSRADGGSVKRIIVELVKSDAFRVRGGAQ